MQNKNENVASQLVSELLDMMIAYEHLMRVGRERIFELGGECDSVMDMMECDHALIKAKSYLKNHHGVNFNLGDKK